MILVIDNYDSFTYNLVQYIGELGAEMRVVRNDQLTVAEVELLKPDRIIISPGPCTPSEAGISVELVRAMYKHTSILGVCLGHQVIGQAFGGSVVRAPSIVHGKTSKILHNESDLFSKIPSPFLATRYHSLIVDKASISSDLEITAWTEDGIIMGLRHRNAPTYGVQFHPESIATEHGKTLLKNFLSIRS